MQNNAPLKISPSKILIIRLSSLGDVILSTSVLEIERYSSSDVQIDWLTSSEFAPLVKTHPKVKKTWEFSRSLGLRSWILMCRRLWDENYDMVIDLHNSLRTQIARLLFLYWKSKEKSSRVILWRTVPKQRWKLWGYFLLKKLWPKFLRPDPIVSRFALCGLGTGNEKPRLMHLVHADFDPGFDWKKPYFCVMASSAWKGKIWDSKKFLAVISKTKAKPVILGKFGDFASHQLQNLLRENGIDHVAGVGKWSISETATILSKSLGYLGNDTGFAHLAEAVGVPAYIVYGPTTQDMGFGPWRTVSRGFSSDLWCRPCGKDGRYCFRLKNKYLCLSKLNEEQVNFPL